MVRVAAAVLVLAVAVPGGAGAATSPCAGDASLCVATTSPAGCRSVGAVVPPATPAHQAVSQVFASTPDPVPDAAHAHVAAVGPVEGMPGPRVHVGGVESFCQAYLSFPGFANRKACGRAGASEVVIDFGAGFVISARDLMAEACSAAGTQSGPVNAAWIGSVTIAAGGVSRTISGSPPPNTVVEVGDVVVALNERFVLPGSCLQVQGSALRVTSGATTVIVGWVSTAACA